MAVTNQQCPDGLSANNACPECGAMLWWNMIDPTILECSRSECEFRCNDGPVDDR